MLGDCKNIFIYTIYLYATVTFNIGKLFLNLHLTAIMNTLDSFYDCLAILELHSIWC